MKVRGIIYDWDGTLFDSGHRVSVPRLERVLAEHGHALTASGRERMRNLWGVTGAPFIMQVLGISEREADFLYKEWERLDVIDPLPLVEGAAETVRLLAQWMPAAIVTSRHRFSLDPVLEQEGLDEIFCSIVGHEDTVFHKPDGRAFNAVLDTFQRHGVSKEECLFVGDTAVDIMAGKNASIRTLVVETGPYREIFADTHPVTERDILSSVADLPRWILENTESPVIQFPPK